MYNQSISFQRRGPLSSECDIRSMRLDCFTRGDRRWRRRYFAPAMAPTWSLDLRLPVMSPAAGGYLPSCFGRYCSASCWRRGFIGPSFVRPHPAVSPGSSRSRNTAATRDRQALLAPFNSLPVLITHTHANKRLPSLSRPENNHIKPNGASALRRDTFYSPLK